MSEWSFCCVLAVWFVSLPVLCTWGGKPEQTRAGLQRSSDCRSRAAESVMGRAAVLGWCPECLPWARLLPGLGSPLSVPRPAIHTPWKGGLVLSLWERRGCWFPRHFLADFGFGSSNTVLSSSFIYGWIASPGCPENPRGFPVVSLPVYVGNDSRQVTVVQRGRQCCLKSAGRAGSSLPAQQVRLSSGGHGHLQRGRCSALCDHGRSELQHLNWSLTRGQHRWGWCPKEALFAEWPEVGKELNGHWFQEFKYLATGLKHSLLNLM